MTWASSCVNFHILRHVETCRPLLVLKQSCTAADGLEPVSSKVSSAQHLHKNLGSKQVKTMPKSTSISHSWSVCLSKHSDPAITLFRYNTIEKNTPLQRYRNWYPYNTSLGCCHPPSKTHQRLASCCEEMGGGCMCCCSQASACNESELEWAHGNETTNQRNGLF